MWLERLFHLRKSASETLAFNQAQTLISENKSAFAISYQMGETV